MKKYLPFWLKYPLWWVFKSPQRELGWITLWRDLAGLFRIFKYRLGFNQKLQPVSICVGIKDRSELFLNHFLPSLLKCKHPEIIELSIYDCGSKDVMNLKAELEQKWKGKLVFTSEPESFQRARDFNKAVRQAGNDLVFLCDADFSLPSDLVEKCNGFTQGGAFWFPIVFYLYKGKPPLVSKENGEWMLWGGKGLLAGSRKDFLACGGLDERFVDWGKEDEAFWLHLHQLGKVIVRTKEKGLLHHWHPSMNPKYKLPGEVPELRGL